MGSFFAAAFGYPTALFTALLGVAMVYWLLALLGVVDFESDGIELDLQADASADDLGALAGFIVAFGLAGVPFSIVFTLIVLVAWTLSCLAAMWLLTWVPAGPLHWLAGTAVLVGSGAIALPVTARLVRPLRKLFVAHNAISNAALVGQPCRVLSQSVSESFGRAEVAQRGAAIAIRVRARQPNTLAKGDAAVILEYDSAAGHYLIEAAPQ